MTAKILTVDDSKTIRMIVKKAFKPYDCELFEGENGVEGLSIASKEKPSLIILDITMPVMTGVEMLEKLKKEPELQDIPVIMLTAESGKENVMQIVKMGVKDYIVKPFKGEQLIERAKAVLPLEEKPTGKQGSDAAAAVEEYFSKDGDIHILTLPEKVRRSVIVAVEGAFKPKAEEIVNSGNNKIILDLTSVMEISLQAVQLIILIIETCQSSKIYIRIVGSSMVEEEFKKFKETSEIPIHATIEQSKSSF